MNKWKYKRNTEQGIMTEKELDIYGEDGWELIQIISRVNSYTHVFKKQLC